MPPSAGQTHVGAGPLVPLARRERDGIAGPAPNSEVPRRKANRSGPTIRRPAEVPQPVFDKPVAHNAYTRASACSPRSRVRGVAWSILGGSGPLDSGSNPDGPIRLTEQHQSLVA